MSNIDRLTQAVQERITADRNMVVPPGIILAVVEALIGLRIITTEPPLLHTPTAAAKWLATASGHPRYMAGDGWHRLLNSSADVATAYSLAVRACTGDSDATRRCATARSILNEHHRSPAIT